jgi:hypothetical protein
MVNPRAVREGCLGRGTQVVGFLATLTTLFVGSATLGFAASQNMISEGHLALWAALIAFIGFLATWWRWWIAAPLVAAAWVVLEATLLVYELPGNKVFSLLYGLPLAIAAVLCLVCWRISTKKSA